jgi:hypothetical protein
MHILAHFVNFFNIKNKKDWEVIILLEKWTGNVVGKMHINRITYDELATKLRCTKAYVSMVLNGSRHPANAEQKFNDALNELIQEKQASQSST